MLLKYTTFTKDIKENINKKFLNSTCCSLLFYVYKYYIWGKNVLKNQVHDEVVKSRNNIMFWNKYQIQQIYNLHFYTYIIQHPYILRVWRIIIGAYKTNSSKIIV